MIQSLLLLRPAVWEPGKNRLSGKSSIAVVDKLFPQKNWRTSIIIHLHVAVLEHGGINAG
jgi:hypothetical protein